MTGGHPTIGPYRVVRRIAEGGYGVVFEAAGPAGERVAVKLLRVLDREAVARFEREQRLLASLGFEEGFVPLLDAGASPEGPWLAMPLLAGGTLRDRLRTKGKLEPAEALAIGRALAGALGRAHALGIVHRDLKPENVLFDERGRPLVADLGLARHFRTQGAPTGGSITRPDAMAGTLGYMAPEQLEDARDAGPPADVFALGVILYELLVGERPFEAAGVLSFVAAVSGERPGSLRAKGVPVSAAVDSAIRRALEREPSARPADALAFLRELDSGSGSSRRTAALLVAMLALGVIVLLAALLRGGPAPRPAPPPPSPRPVVAPPPAALLPRIEDAEAALREKPPRTADALRIAEEVLARSPEDPRALTVSGLARKEEDLEHAYDDLHRAARIEPTVARCVALGEKARGMFLKTGSKDFAREVVDAYGAAIALAPGDDELLFQRGRARGELLSDFEGAFRDFDRCCTLRPDYWNHLAHRAWVRTGRREYREALADLDRALALEPHEPLVLRWRSEVRTSLGDLDGAIADLEDIVAHVPDPAHAQRKIAEERLPELRRRAGR